MVQNNTIVEIYDEGQSKISMVCFEKPELQFYGWCYAKSGRFGLCQRSCKMWDKFS